MEYIYKALEKAHREGKTENVWDIKPINFIHFDDSGYTFSEKLRKNFYLLANRIIQEKVKNGIQSIAFTSSISGEGCSTIIYHLSQFLSNQFLYSGTRTKTSKMRQSGQRNSKSVLLIDANFHHPVLHSLFNVKLEGGLVDLLTRSKFNKKCVKETCNEQIDLVTTGIDEPRLHNFMDFGRLKLMYNKLKENYDHILIDCMSVRENADSLPICKYSDGVLLIVRSGHVKFEYINEAKKSILDANGKILGVILNDRKFELPDKLKRI